MWVRECAYNAAVPGACPESTEAFFCPVHYREFQSFRDEFEDAVAELSEVDLRGARVIRVSDDYDDHARVCEPPDARERFVYFCGAYSDVGDLVAVKIGSALDPESRLSGFQTGCPLELRLIALSGGGYSEERRLHALWANHRKRGEWFSPVVLELLAVDVLSNLYDMPTKLVA